MRKWIRDNVRLYSVNYKECLWVLVKFFIKFLQEIEKVIQIFKVKFINNFLNKFCYLY